MTADAFVLGSIRFDKLRAVAFLRAPPTRPDSEGGKLLRRQQDPTLGWEKISLARVMGLVGVVVNKYNHYRSNADFWD